MDIAKHISVSDEVYEMLLERKSDKRFSETIKEALLAKSSIMEFAGTLSKAEGKKLKAQIQKERKQNYGREFNW